MAGKIVRPRDIPVIVAGCSAVLIQILALRNFISLFAGNELDIGITLAVWLLEAGMGSYAGTRLRSDRLFPLTFLATGLLAPLIIPAIPITRHLLPTVLGEAVTLPQTLLITSVFLLPLCLTAGLQFPLAVLSGGRPAGKVYALEAAGASIGGILFSFFLAGRVDSAIVSAGVGLLNVLTALAMMGKRSLIALLLVPLGTPLLSERLSRLVQWGGGELVDRTESRYGEIVVTRSGHQYNVFSSGKFYFSYPDPQAVELRVHLPASLHPDPRNIVVIGGSPALITEFLTYPIDRLDFVEMDPAVSEMTARVLSAKDRESLHDRRVRVIAGDARSFLRRAPPLTYDLVLVNLPPPSTATINRFYTVEFFREVRTALAPGGMLCLTVLPSSGYISRRVQMLNGSVFRSLRKVFPTVEASSEEYGYLLASAGGIDLSPEELSRRFRQRGVRTVSFGPSLLDDAFSPLKVRAVIERLRKVEALNTDKRPIAYLFGLMVWTEVHGGRFLNYLLEGEGMTTGVLLLLPFILPVPLLRGRMERVASYSVFTTGYVGISLSLTTMLAYQAQFGYVYEMIGLLTGLFMTGMAAGSYLAQGGRDPLKKIRSAETGGLCLMLLSPLLLLSQFTFYLLSLLTGLVAGFLFAAGTGCLEGRGPAGASGRIYALDLAGSFYGALATAIVSIPLLGIYRTILFLVLVKGVSMILLLTVGHEKA